MKNNIILGVDIGGTGIKGGLIDIEKGEMISERHRIPTPQPATPESVGRVFKELTNHFSWTGTVGVGFPAVIRNGVACSAANIDKSWLGTNIEEVLSKHSNNRVFVLNDADAAGIASMRYGIGRNQKGVTIMLTIGTGIGSALFIDKKLVPNTEFGHFYLKSQKEVAEKQLSKKARKEQQLNWSEWGARFNDYLVFLKRLFSPDLIIIGGGSSKRFKDFQEFITVDFDVEPAILLNQAGAIGAAYFAWEQAVDRLQ